jgi:P-type Ca2+ transporter type 2C
MNWHHINTDEVLQKLNSSRKGLPTAEAQRRLQEYGPNEIINAQKKSAWTLLVHQFTDFMTLVLAGAAIISGLLGDITDTIVIVVIIVLNAVIGFVQQYRAEKAMEALKKMAGEKSLVIRDNKRMTIPSNQLVPGDIILLEAGNMIAADARLSDTVQFKVNESSLTGESMPVEKRSGTLKESGLTPGDQLNMAFRGTSVTNGHATAIVVATGMETELGKIAQMLTSADTQTPLQKKLTALGKNLAYAVLAICAIVFGIGYLRGEDTVLMLLTALSLAVAAIPEALPAVITVALALGAKKMVRRNVLVRKLPAVETLGSVTYICTDKTGTLTMNKMTVEEAAGLNFSIGKEKNTEANTDEDYKNLLLGMALNNDVFTDKKDEAKGDPMEIAMYQFALAQGFDKNVLEKEYPRVAEIPFDADRKRMTTIHKYKDKYLVLVKGAMEVLVENADAKADTDKWKELMQSMLVDGKRVLGFALKQLDELPSSISPKAIEIDLHLAGIVGITDPPREEAQQAVQECKSAGIKAVMITGDHPVTATAIGKRLGIIESDSDIAITGPELNKFSDEELKEKARHAKVYARVSPEQKLRIVKALQVNGENVAMTGDGVNDAPALKHADIGVAMGITGTDVSKEAASLILLDDNFATIVKAVKEGRRIYDNIRKFIRYILTGNAAEILTIFLAPFFSLPMPLLPIHILWINLVTDGLPGLALAAERAEKDIMQRPPRDPRQNIFSDGLGIHVMWVSLLLAAVTIGTQAYAIRADNTHWQTMVFTVLCLGQLAHVLAIRSEKVSIFRHGFWSNRLLLLAVAGTFLLQLATIYVPFLNRLFKTQPLSFSELMLCIGLALVIFAAVEVEKLVRRKRTNQSLKAE